MAGCHFGVTRHVVKHGLEPSGFHADIAVEQQAELAINLGNGFVVAFGKTIVVVEDDGADVGELLRKQSERIVCAAIVGNDNFRLGRVLDDGRQEPTQHLGAVPVEYDDAQ